MSTRVESTPDMLDLFVLLRATVRDWYTLAPSYRTKRKLCDMLSDAVIEWQPTGRKPQPRRRRIEA